MRDSDPSNLETREEIDLFRSTEEDQDKLIHERRLRRQAILQKYQSLPAPTRKEPAEISLQVSIDPSTLDAIDFSKPGTIKQVRQEQDMSAADYDPNKDEELVRHAPPCTVDPIRLADPDDMFSQDMFAPLMPLAQQPDLATHILESAPVLRNFDNPALVDNWDDAEGYYRAFLFFMFIARHHHGRSLGRALSRVHASRKGCLFFSRQGFRHALARVARRGHQTHQKQ